MAKVKKKKSDGKVQTPIRVGNAVHIRTVTHYYTGKIVAIEDDHLVLVRCSWIAWPSQEWKTLLSMGKIDSADIQPFPGPVAIGRGAIVDATSWTHPLPGHS